MKNTPHSYVREGLTKTTFVSQKERQHTLKEKGKKKKKTSTQSKLNTRELELSWKQDKIIGGINGQRWRNHPLELGNGIAHRKEDLEVILNLTLGFLTSVICNFCCFQQLFFFFFLLTTIA